MDSCSCKICGSSSLIIFEHTAKCRSCGVLLYYPYPEDDSSLMFKDEGKSSWERESVLGWYSDYSFYNHANFTNMVKFVMGESYKGKKLKILDYGGGGGQFALVCKSLFPECSVYITDISDESLLEEWRSMNTQISFRQFDSNATTFDLIFLNDVFEHVSDPVFVLKQLAGKLTSGGKLFIDTPKQFWIYPVTKYLAKSLYKKVLNGTVSTAHLQIWSNKSFQTTVRKSKLKIDLYSETSEYTLPASVYMENMGIKNPLVKLAGKVFYSNAKYLAKNKIQCVLSRNTA